jgi:hypothetical protein
MKTYKNQQELIKDVKEGDYFLIKGNYTPEFGKGLIVHVLKNNKFNVIDKYYGGYFSKDVCYLPGIHGEMQVKPAKESDIRWIDYTESYKLNYDNVRKRESDGHVIVSGVCKTDIINTNKDFYSII